MVSRTGIRRPVPGASGRAAGALAALLPLAVLLLGPGCLKIKYLIQLEDDGRGVLTEVVKVERKLLMLQKSVPQAAGFERMLTEEHARRRAKLMNARFVGFQAAPTRDGGLESTASYTFDRIDQLRLPLYPWPSPSTQTYWQKAQIGFTYSDDEVRRYRNLWIYTVPGEEDAKAPRSEKPADDGPRRSSPAELQQLRRLLPLFRDMVEGFHLFVRLQVGRKNEWLQSCPAHVTPPPFTFRAWDGQYTLLSVTDKDLTFDEDAMMIVVPWEIAGNEKALTDKLADSRYFIHANGTEPGRSWDIARLHWEYIRLDGVWRYHARSLPDQGVSRLLPMDVPDVPPPPPAPRPDRYHYQYLGMDMRVLPLKDKAAPAAGQFMNPSFDDSSWAKMNLLVGEAQHAEPVILYRKRFTVPADWKGQVVQLRFGGVRDRCAIYLNGGEIGRNDGWNKRFWIDVADKVDYGGQNLLAVHVENLTDKGGIWGEVDVGDTRLTGEFHLSRQETLAEETEAQKKLRAELPALGGIIAFAMHKPGEPEMKENWDVYTMKPDGSDLRAVVAHPAADLDPRISPDGKTILFLSLRDRWEEVRKLRKVPRNVGEEYGAYYTVDIAGRGEPKRLGAAKDLGGQACWAPDGRAIAFARHSPPGIHIRRLDDGKVISHVPPDVQECASPAFSPDGRRLYFISIEQSEADDRWGAAYIAHLEPGTWALAGKQWEKCPYGPARSVAVSPDGRQIATNTSHVHPGIRWEQFRWSWLMDSISPRRRDDRLGKTDLGFGETWMRPHWRSEAAERRMFNESPVWAPNSRYLLFTRGPDWHEAACFQFTHWLPPVDWMDLYLADPAERRCVRLTWLRSRIGPPDWWAER